MSFNVNNLTEVRALGNNRWHWHYFTTDTLATVLAADYFSTHDGLAKFHRGDVLEIVASTAAEYQQVSIASVSGGSVVVRQATVPDATQAAQAPNKGQLDAALAARLRSKWSGATDLRTPPGVIASPVTPAVGTSITITGTTAFVAQTDALFTYYGGTPAFTGPGFAPTLYYYLVGVTHPTAKSFSAAVEFHTDADQIDILTSGNGSVFRVLVDGQLAASGVTTLPNDGTILHVTVDFGSSALRRIRIEGAPAFCFGGIRQKAKYSLWPIKRAVSPRLIIVGDSYVEGFGNTSAMHGWAAVCARALGVADLYASGVYGAGYLNNGSGVTLRNRLSADVLTRSPDLVVYAPGHNDTTVANAAYTAAALQAECKLVFDLHAAALPTVPAVVLAGIWSGTPGTAQNNASAAIIAAAQDASSQSRSMFQTVNTLTWILGTSTSASPNNSGNTDTVLLADGVHLTDAGALYVGLRAAGEFAALLPGFF